ncbi:MAG: hypothetical protein GY820_04405, partial [Gammaproteobacteria bacterium]|nr:hypothetical protein [Gammaproteobacteria bacterium]
MSDILQQMNQLKVRLDKVKKYTHQKMLLKQRVSVTNPDSQVEGEVAVQTSDTEVEELKFLEACSRDLSFHFNQRFQALSALLIGLRVKLVPLYPVMTKKEGDVLTEITGLTSRINKICHEFTALEDAGKITDENTQELEMKFHEVCQEVSEFMEFHGVATSKPLGEELRQNLANSPGSAVKSTRDDNTVF